MEGPSRPSCGQGHGLEESVRKKCEVEENIGKERQGRASAFYKPRPVPLRRQWGGDWRLTTGGQGARLPVRNSATACSHASQLLTWLLLAFSHTS